MEFSVMSISNALISEFSSLFNRVVINPSKINEAERAYNKLIANKARYEAVGKKFANAANPMGLPFYFIGCIHMREADFDFTKHLHNGDSLQQRTYHVPMGRPAIGNAPFTWEQSATDALQMKFAEKKVWRDAILQPLKPELLLQMLEVYNGNGYRPAVLGTRAIVSPYLWAGSNIQQPGKYVADSKFSSNTIDSQLGAGVLLKYYLEKEKKKSSNSGSNNPFTRWYSNLGFFVYGE